MDTFTLKYVQENLETVTRKVIESGEGVFVTTDLGRTLVMVPLKEWSAMKESTHLMSDPTDHNPPLESNQAIPGSQQE